MIPELEKVFYSVRELKRRAEGKIDVENTGPSPDLAEHIIRKSQVEFLIAEINNRLESLYKLGCLPKDIDAGLADFPALIDGQEVYLCWKLGEKSIGFWHLASEGFSGRKPLAPPVKKL
jgi:hypothetical protein